jgi:hypothetical protein
VVGQWWGSIVGIGLPEAKSLGAVPDDLPHRWMFEEPERHQAEPASIGETAGAYPMARYC